MAQFDAGSIEATLTLDEDPFIAGLRDAQRRAEAFERDPIEATVDVEVDDASLAKAQFVVDSLGRAVHVPIVPDVDPTMNFAVDALGKAVYVPIKPTISPYDIAKIDAMVYALRESFRRNPLEVSIQVTNLTSVMTRLGSIRRYASRPVVMPVIPVTAPADRPGLGAVAGAALGGLSSLFYGGAARHAAIPFTGIGGGVLPGAFSLGSFMGLGVEHLVMTGVAVASTAIGAALGGALKVVGAGVTGIVGMGTDLAGIGQAAGDIKSTYTNLQLLTTAIQTYGKASRQAAAAQATLTAGLHDFSAVARPAVLAAAQQAVKFRKIFDQVTGPAEKIGAQIINQGIQVAEKALPIIGKFATENMGIIQRGIQPLFKFLAGPGMKILTDIETKFQKELPTAMRAFVNGAEVVLKMFDWLSQHSGGFLTALNKWLSFLNTPQGTAKWEATFTHLESLFKSVWAFIKALVSDINLVLKADAGTGKSIFDALTGQLDHLNSFLQSAAGHDQLKNYLQVHKNEILALLGLLPGLISAFSQIVFTIGPPLASLFTDFVKFAEAIASIPFVGPLVTTGAALAVIARQLGIIKGIGAIQNFFGGKGVLGNLVFPGRAAAAERAAAGGVAGVEAGLAGGVAGAEAGAEGGLLARLGLAGIGARLLSPEVAIPVTLALVLGHILIKDADKQKAAANAAIAKVPGQLKLLHKLEIALNVYPHLSTTVHPVQPPPSTVIPKIKKLIESEYNQYVASQTPGAVTVPFLINPTDKNIGSFFKANIQGLYNILHGLHIPQLGGIGLNFAHSIVDQLLGEQLHPGVSQAEQKFLDTLSQKQRKSILAQIGQQQGGWNPITAIEHGWESAFNTFRGVFESQAGASERTNADALSKRMYNELVAADKKRGITPPTGTAFAESLAKALKTNASLKTVTGVSAAFGPTPVGPAGAGPAATGASIIAGIMNGLTGNWHKVVAWIANLPAQIKSHVGNVSSILTPEGRNVIKGFHTGLTSSWHNVTSWFHDMKAHILSHVTGGETWLKRSGENIVKGLRNGLTSGWKTVTTWFHDMKAHILSHVTGGETWLKPVGERIVKGLHNGLISGWKTVTTWFADMKAHILSHVTGGESWLKPTGQNIITGLRNGLLQAWRTVNSWFQHLHSVVVAYFSGAGSWLVSAGQRIVQGLLNGLNSGLPRIRSWASSVRGIIMGAFAGASGWLVGVGSSIASGLASGLSAGINAAASQAASAAAGIGAKVKAAANAGLKSGSPSRLMADEVGKWIPYGIAAGITEHQHAIEAAIRAIPFVSVSDKALNVNIVGAHGAAAMGGTHHHGPAIHIEHAVFKDELDLKTLFNKADFLIQTRRVG